MSDKKTKDSSITIEGGVDAFKKVNDVSGAVASLDPVGGKIFKFKAGILNIVQLAVSDNRAKTSLQIGLGTAAGAVTGAVASFGAAALVPIALPAAVVTAVGIGVGLAASWLGGKAAGMAYDKSETVKKVTDAAYNTVANAAIKTKNTVLGSDFNTLKDQNTQDQKTLPPQNNDDDNSDDPQPTPPPDDDDDDDDDGGTNPPFKPKPKDPIPPITYRPAPPAPQPPDPGRPPSVFNQPRLVPGIGYKGKYSESSSDSDSGGGSGKPIILDLDGDGIELVDLKDSSVFFDINGDGYRNNMGWVNADDGFLAIDINGDGLITDFRELAFKEWDDNARTDLEGLKQFDSNGNGYLDKGDRYWSKFGVWQDKNQNGITDAGEFKTLDTFGMKQLKLDSDRVTTKHGRNTSYGTGEYEMTDGTKRKFGDIGLGYSDLGFKIRANGDVDMRSVTGRVIREVKSDKGVVVGLDTANLAGVIGGAGNDHLITGNALNVFLSGQDGNDILTGGAGDDWLIGGDGRDVLIGGEGHDILFFDSKDIMVSGGEGYDVAYAVGDTGVSFNVNDGLTSIEAIFGTKHNDSFTTSGREGYFANGGAGDDSFTGRQGNDSFNAGAGDDVLKTCCTKTYEWEYIRRVA